ncbi:MAG: murein L,D-transpeptidase catalytic domain family protein, partial [Bacteroidales bacterium]|nr:murein L,D-transpeptidase catalytic domain family protein [Bacteroidales bacterium]
MGNREINSSSENFNPDPEVYFTWFYKTLNCDVPKPEYEVFTRAITGFFNLKAGNKIKNNLLTIIDFSLSSNTERMWIVDMNRIKVVHHSLVAHGRNSGDEFATSFSNKPSSFQSSLGFYLTDEIYYGG